MSGNMFDSGRYGCSSTSSSSSTREFHELAYCVQSEGTSKVSNDKNCLKRRSSGNSERWSPGLVVKEKTQNQKAVSSNPGAGWTFFCINSLKILY